MSFNSSWISTNWGERFAFSNTYDALGRVKPSADLGKILHALLATSADE